MLVSKITLKSQKKVDLSKGPFSVSLSFNIQSNVEQFFETPCTVLLKVSGASPRTPISLPSLET